MIKVIRYRSTDTLINFQLAGLTFWTRLESPNQEDVDMSTVKQYLNSEVTSEAQTRPESASKKCEKPTCTLIMTY